MVGPLICPNCGVALDEEDPDVFLWRVRNKFYCGEKCAKHMAFIATGVIR